MSTAQRDPDPYVRIQGWLGVNPGPIPEWAKVYLAPEDMDDSEPYDPLSATESAPRPDVVAQAAQALSEAYSGSESLTSHRAQYRARLTVPQRPITRAGRGVDEE